MTTATRRQELHTAALIRVAEHAINVQKATIVILRSLPATRGQLVNTLAEHELPPSAVDSAIDNLIGDRSGAETTGPIEIAEYRAGSEVYAVKS